MANSKEPPFLNLGKHDPQQQIFIGRLHHLPPEFRGQLHRHTHYEIMWLASGTATFFSDFVDYPLTDGTLIFVRPGQLHMWLGQLENVDLVVVSFKPELLTLHNDPGWMMNALPYFEPATQPYLTLDEAAYTLIAPLFDALSGHYKTFGEQNRDLLAAYLQVILVEAKRLYQPLSPTDDIPSAVQLTKAFYQAVEQQFVDHRTTRPYAQQLGVTANHLTRLIRQTTGISPGKILRDRLLLEAKRLLVHADYTVSEIADRLQFNSSAQFSNWFKREADVSPSHFRQQFLEA